MRTRCVSTLCRFRKTTFFNLLILLVTFTIIHVTLVGQRFSFSRITCSTDELILTVVRYLEMNASFPLDTILPETCDKPSKTVRSALAYTVNNMVTKCDEVQGRTNEDDKTLEHLVHTMLSNSQRKINLKKYKSGSDAILTLVTTFPSLDRADKEKSLVYQNTILNWARLKPRINVILFANGHLSDFAKSKGWDVIPTKPAYPNFPEKPPVLKEMFARAKEMYDTKWYGYANADILFTTDLLEHVEKLYENQDSMGKSKMLIGRRTNIENIHGIDPLSDDNLLRIAASRGQLYREDAEDFFIATKSFRWETLLPVVVGRPAYDNWLVAEARCRLQTDVIDVTDTLLALHQTTFRGGNREGHTHIDSDANLRIFQANRVIPNFLVGITSCTSFHTISTSEGSIGIVGRTFIDIKCNCHFYAVF